MSRVSKSQTLPREKRLLIDDSVKSVVPSLHHNNSATQAVKHRPVSLYDNLRGVGTSGSGTISSTSGALSVGNLTNHQQPSADVTASSVMDRSPSQANCLSTTVPQNIAGTHFAGRHTPTRSSLRHSRMIVQSRRRVSRKYQPRIMRQHRLATGLAALHTLLGVSVTLLSGWLLVWAPHLNTRDIPYWSGVPLLFSGIVGLILLSCCRKDYPGKPAGLVSFSLRVLSVLLSTVASVTCVCASAFALLHLTFLSSMSCEPANVLNASCVCRSHDNGTASGGGGERSFRYIDLNCPEVSSILSVLLIGSCAANGIAGCLAAWYVFLHWHSRYTNLYSEVKTNEDGANVIGNKMDPTILNRL